MSKKKADAERKEITGFPGYAVDMDGVVWSRRAKGRPTSGQVKERWNKLSILRRSYGACYCVVCLRPIPGGRVYCRYVHRLVLEAFVGPCPPNMVACHNDGDTRNNKLDNLRWGTQQENNEDKKTHDTTRLGSRAHNTKLTEMDVLSVFILRRLGLDTRGAGYLVGMTQNEAAAILRGDRWPHVRRLYKAVRVMAGAFRAKSAENRKPTESQSKSPQGYKDDETAKGTDS